MWDDWLKEQGLAKEVKSKTKMESFSFSFGLKLGTLLSSHMDTLSKTLQSEKMSAVGGNRLANLTFDVIEGLRKDENFNMLHDNYLNAVKKFPFVKEAVLKRKRKTPNYSILQCVEGCQTTASSHYPGKPRDHYRKVCYESIDSLVSSVRATVLIVEVATR